MVQPFLLPNKQKEDRQGNLSEMENVISITTDNIKHLEAQQLRNMKSAFYRSPTWSKPANTNLWVIYKLQVLSVLLDFLLQFYFDYNTSSIILFYLFSIIITW